MAVEKDANVQLRVELMEPAEFASYLATRASAVAGLPQAIANYSSKRHLLDLAVTLEKAAAESLRALAAITIQDGAAGLNLTEQRKTAMLIKARQVITKTYFTLDVLTMLLHRTCLRPGKYFSMSRLPQTMGGASHSMSSAADRPTT